MMDDVHPSGASGRPELTLGPVLYNWSAQRLRDFYARIADEAPVDRVVIGEVICPKREPLAADALAWAAERLAAAGKRVVLASLALVMDDRDWEATLALGRDAEAFEANDLSAVEVRKGRPFAVGPFVNVYGLSTLRWLKELGAERICFGAELDREKMAALAREPGMEKEVIVFGRLPLALSARCYHARAHGLRKDECRFVCGEDPDGLPVTTLDGQAFVAVNGIATMSASYVDLTREWEELAGMGVSGFRLLPQAVDMVAVARVWRDLLDGRIAGEEAHARIRAIAGGVPLANGFFHGGIGRAEVARPAGA